MTPRQFSFGVSGNPIAQVLSVLVFGLLLIGALIMGAVVLAVLFGIAIIAGAVLAVRLWWLRRKLRAAGAFDPAPESPPDTRLIEGEYTVVEKSATRETHGQSKRP
jgi:hypothetical protein